MSTYEEQRFLDFAQARLDAHLRLLEEQGTLTYQERLAVLQALSDDWLYLTGFLAGMLAKEAI